MKTFRFSSKLKNNITFLFLNISPYFRSYQFKLEEVESFRYRAKDAWRAVTKIAVREARLKEIKQEIFNCQKLKVSELI